MTQALNGEGGVGSRKFPFVFFVPVFDWSHPWYGRWRQRPYDVFVVGEVGPAPRPEAGGIPSLRRVCTRGARATCGRCYVFATLNLKGERGASRFATVVARLVSARRMAHCGGGRTHRGGSNVHIRAKRRFHCPCLLLRRLKW